MKNYYEELGLASDATAEQIERAYRWLAQKFHPDRNADFQDEAKSRFVRIQEAYEVLSDPLARAQYDEKLRRTGKKSASDASSKTASNSESRFKKRKKRSVLLSPLYISVLLGIAALALLAIFLNTSNDQNVITKISTTATNAVAKVPSLEKRDVSADVKQQTEPSDGFTEGSKWIGAWISTTPGKEGAGDYNLTISERIGNKFKGEIHASHDGDFSYIAGKIDGDQVAWSATRVIRTYRPDAAVATYNGTINGDFYLCVWPKNDATGETVITLMHRDTDSDVTQSRGKASETKAEVPDDAVVFKGSHYKYFDDKSTWYLAKQKCEELGGHLICIGGAEEDTFAQTVLESAKSESAWIGGNSDMDDALWRWATGEPFSYTGWAPDQPDNWSGEGETCLAMWAANTRLPKGWHDMADGYRQGFICEWDSIPFVRTDASLASSQHVNGVSASGAAQTGSKEISATAISDLKALLTSKTWYFHWEEQPPTRDNPLRFLQNGQVQDPLGKYGWSIKPFLVLEVNNHYLIPIDENTFEGFFIPTGRQVGLLADPDKK